MMLSDLREQVCRANQALSEKGLVILTWGNVSAYDSATGLIVIKPSGVPYEELTPQNMVVVDIFGNIVEGNFNPSSDTPTHVEIYKAFPQIGSIVHTHSPWATIWAQAGMSIPPFGTTHADDFGGSIPCTRGLSSDEINCDYEKNTGLVICETLRKNDFSKCFAVNVKSHGPFIWEKTPGKAVDKALVLEQVAMMAWMGKDFTNEIPAQLLNKHFERKHGENAYYGQK